jgi:ribosomal protein L18E
MAFNVSALADYTEQNEALLVTSSVLGAKTASLIKSAGNVMVGVKSSETINIMDTDAVFQSGGSCGFNASGSTSFTQRTVTVGKIKVNEALCPKDLEAKYLQKALPTGSMYDSIPFEQEFSEKKAKRIASQLEISLWQGNTASGNVNLNKFDGIMKLADADASVVNANVSAFISGAPISAATGITAANVVSIFDGVYRAIPAQIVSEADVTIFCGMDTFRTYTIALKNANLFHYQINEKADNEFILPGTTIKVVAVQGLNGTNRIYAMRLSNLFLGTDLLNEEEKFEIFYAKEADQVRFVSEFKMGVNYAFGDEIVDFILS